MQTHLQSNVTVANVDNINDVSMKDILFRVSNPMQFNTQKAGQTSYVYFTANSHKTIDLPISADSADTLRIIGQTDGTLEIVSTHPTLGSQTMLVKEGIFSFSTNSTALIFTEMAGRNTTMQLSIIIISATSEEFS